MMNVAGSLGSSKEKCFKIRIDQIKNPVTNGKMYKFTVENPEAYSVTNEKKYKFTVI